MGTVLTGVVVGDAEEYSDGVADGDGHSVPCRCGETTQLCCCAAMFAHSEDSPDTVLPKQLSETSLDAHGGGNIPFIGSSEPYTIEPDNVIAAVR